MRGTRVPVRVAVLVCQSVFLNTKTSLLYFVLYGINIYYVLYGILYYYTLTNITTTVPVYSRAGDHAVQPALRARSLARPID